MSVTGFNRRRRAIKEKPKKQEIKQEELEEMLEEFYTDNGWYEIPGIDKKLRKNDAIKALKG